MTGWRHARLALVGALLLILVLYRDTTFYLVDLWSRFEDGSYGHGFLVLAVALFLIYQRRDRLVALTSCPDVRALPVVALCVLVWMAAALADVQLVQAVCLLPLILAVAWAMVGMQVARQLLLPVMFIMFALPIWSPLLPALREMTAAGAFVLVRVSGITAFLQDYEVYLPSGQLSIEDACSGLNYLLAALTLGVFYALLNYRSVRARLLVVVIAAGAALVANILRVAVIIYLAYITDMQHPLVKDHLMLGWYLFGALVLVLLLADLKVYRARGITADAEDAADDAIDASACRNSLAWGSFLLTVVAMLLVSGPLFAEWLKSRPVSELGAVPVMPPGQSGWLGPLPMNDSWMPVYHGATEARHDYYKDGTRVLLYVALYSRQSQGSELINDLNRISNDKLWWQTGSTRQFVSNSGLPIRESRLLSAEGQRRLVWFLYRVSGHYTTSPYVAKVLQVAGLLTGRRGAAAVVVAVDNDGDITVVRRELDDFLTVMEPALARLADGNQNTQGQNR